jgi:hypothetical protein
MFLVALPHSEGRIDAVTAVYTPVYTLPRFTHPLDGIPDSAQV